MFKSLLRLFVTDTSSDTLIVFSGTIANVLIGGAFYIITPRILGPTNYGFFSLVVATCLLVTSIANFGIDTGILRFVKTEKGELNNQILRLALEAYTIIGLAIFTLGFLFSPLLAKFLGYSELTALFRISFAGVILFLLTNFFVATLQARRKFLDAAIVNISTNTARLILIGMAAYFFTINLYFITALFFSVTIISVFIGRLFVPLDFLKAKGYRQHFKDFFSFNFWIAGGLIISSIPFDNYLLVKFAGPLATGLYAAPFKILNGINQFSGNFSTVLASRLSGFENDKKAIEYSKKTLPFVLFISLAIASSAFVAKFFISLIGNQYANSLVVFQILALGYAFAFANTIAASLIIYYFGKTKVAFWITVIDIASWLVLDLFLIPIYKEVGAAIGVLLSGVIAFIIFNGYVIWRFIKNKNNVPN